MGANEVLISVDGHTYSSFKTSLGDRTLTGDSRFNALSPEKIEQLNFNASAKYGTSFECVDRSLLASGKSSRNCDDGTIVISSIKNSITSLNSSSVNSVSFNNSSPQLLSIKTPER